jgi:GNAT superfamily N-acetyltransferase
MTITVRSAEPADAPALRQLFLRSRRETFVWQPADAFALADFDAQTQDERLWVALDEAARPVGFIALWEPEQFIHHLYVERAWAGHGVGRALLQALPGWPATRFVLKCLCRNEAALAFYRACAFTEVGRGGEGDRAYLLLASHADGAG